MVIPTNQHAGAALLATAVAVFLLSGGAPAALAETGEVHLDAAGIEHDARLVNLKLDRVRNEITLDDTELIEDDAPGSGVPEGMDRKRAIWKEYLKNGVVIRKVLVLDNSAAFSGCLLFEGTEMKGNTEPLRISLNGVEFLRSASKYSHPYTKQYTEYLPYDCWYFVDIPVGALRRGVNEVLMRAQSDSASWCVHISVEQEFARGSLTRPHHPNRSMKSSDGGKTWSDFRLGHADSVDGEYSIRLSLDRYVKSGEYVSPVLDVTGDAGPLKRRVRIGRVGFTVGMDTPEGTKSEVFVRFGASPRTEDPSWTEWTVAGGGIEFPNTGNRRYLQWRAALSTADPLKTPRLRELTIRAEWENLSPNRDLGIAAAVGRNGHVARSSYPFGYENLLHPGLATYRKNAQLDKIVEGASSEFEVMMRLLNWAYRIPVTSNEYSWNWNEVVKLEKGEKGMPRLQNDYKGRRRDAMCLYSNQALIGALLSFGYHARHININSETESGHEIAEVWSNEFNKWIYMDATRDYYYFDLKTGIPLNFLEIHNLVAERVPHPVTPDRPLVTETMTSLVAGVPIGIREGNNPVSVVPDARHILEIAGHFRITPRDDFLTNPRPVPVHTGASAWGWDGFLNWYDEKFPKLREHPRQTNRPLDFYEPLNQAEVYLSETEERGVLAVEISTFTPGFDTFLVRYDDGKWTEQKQPSWMWALRPGKNCIEARARNVRGVLGPVSLVEVTCNP
jgi:hypothetical protein